MIRYTIILISALVTSLPGIYSEHYGGTNTSDYIEVRAGAHMFYWLFHTTAPGVDYRTRPLVIWLSGGPGASSTGYANFVEIGLLDLNMNERRYSWVKHVNVLFIDNPVGTGYSYVEDESLLTTNNHEIARDLINFTKQFLDTHLEFANIPVYIFGESYGGKMAAEYAYDLYKEVSNGNINMILKGVAFGNPWISPIDSVVSWAPFLLQVGMVDYRGFKIIDNMAQGTRQALDAGKHLLATNLWGKTGNMIKDITGGIDFYNILVKIYRRYWPDYEPAVSKTLLKFKPDEDEGIQLDDMMNGPLRYQLSIPENVAWGEQGENVFSSLGKDFMKPVTEIVELLLNETDLEVSVYSGNLDLVVDTAGTLNWVQRLQWPGASFWKGNIRSPLIVDNVIEGYVKKYGRFTFYWILRAGHMVPTDNPVAALRMLKKITHYNKHQHYEYSL